MFGDEWDIACHAVALAVDEGCVLECIELDMDPDLMDVVWQVDMDEYERMDYDTVRQSSLRSISYEE